MCLIVVGINAHPTYEFIAVANRDEHFERKTLGVHFWDSPAILAGKDLEGGGTWLGVAPSGKFAAVTNYRDPNRNLATAPSRGLLPVNFLKSDIPAPVFLNVLSKDAASYNGFNLIVRDGGGTFHYSNISDRVTRLEDGIHGLSNALINTPWPKVMNAKEKLHVALLENHVENSHLAGLLKDTDIAFDRDLPQTGIPIELERALSAMFIKIPGYGTRCTTVVKIKRDKSLELTEIVYNHTGNPIESNTFEWNG